MRERVKSRRERMRKKKDRGVARELPVTPFSSSLLQSPVTEPSG